MDSSIFILQFSGDYKENNNFLYKNFDCQVKVQVGLDKQVFISCSNRNGTTFLDADNVFLSHSSLSQVNI